MALEPQKSSEASLFLTGCAAALTVLVGASALPAAGASPGTRQLIGSVVIYAVIVTLGLLAYIAVHHEHQLRSLASATSPDGDPALPAAASVLPGRAGVQRVGPISARVFGGISAVICLAAFVAAFSVHSVGSQSHRTQADGVATTATVAGVAHVKHTAGFNNTWYTTLIDVALPNGRHSVVHDPHNPAFAVGRKLSILMDPTDRTYSEIPGLPQQDRYTWIVTLFICITAGAMSAASFSQSRQMRRGSRPEMVAAAAAPAT